MIFSIAVSKIALFLIKTLKGTEGSTWPGHIALKLNKNFVKEVVSKNKQLRLVLIAGTNGKTTTTKALFEILHKSGINVIRNSTGANLLNGLASLLLSNINLNGQLKPHVILFEVDENSLPIITPQTNPKGIILLNLFRDQLDRYGEVNSTAEKWESAVNKLNKDCQIIACADDPQIVSIIRNFSGSKYFFTIDNSLKVEEKLQHAVDSTTCPNCRNDLSYLKISYSHLGNYKCLNCGFTNPKAKSVKLSTKLMGTFNIYNLTAAVVASEKIFNTSEEKAISSLKDFAPAFGRQELINIDGKKALILLSKNPTGFNESLKVVAKNKYSNILFILNDRIPDGRDISWIWDVDFEMLERQNLNLFVSGDRVYDLASRLQYANLKNINTYESLKAALQKSLEKTPSNKTLVILPTYSAMLETRKILTGKSIL